MESPTIFTTIKMTQDSEIDRLEKQVATLQNQVKELSEYKSKYNNAIMKMGRLSWEATKARQKLCDLDMLRREMEQIVERINEASN